MHVSEVGVISMASTIALLIGSLFPAPKNQRIQFNLVRVLNKGMKFPSEIQNLQYQWLKTSPHSMKHQKSTRSISTAELINFQANRN